MRGAGVLALSGALGGAVAAGLEPLAEHIDLVPEYSVADEAWTWTVGTDAGEREPGGFFLPVRDLASPQGERFERPEDEAWDFLGMGGGEPVWIVPQSDNGWIWPGFENGQSGLFASYVESDPRASGVARRWVRVILDAVEGPGDFSMFQFQGGGAVPWMASADGISEEDVFLMAVPGHDHMSWAFSEKGVYRVKLRARAYLGPGATSPTTTEGALELVFAVGARASWRALHFTDAEVMDEAVAGDEADPDGDGLVNLLEYAFGTDPRSGGLLNVESGEVAGPELRMIEEGGLSYPALRFFRRIHEDADLSYTVEWSTDPAGEWPGAGVEVSAEPFGEMWERVTVRDSLPAGGRRFGRVRVGAAE